MHFKIIQAVLLITLVFNFSGWALSGTGGSPLGGMGTGYVTFNGQKICVSGTMPPAAANGVEKEVSASGFSFFVNGTAKKQLKATSEDAKCPLQTADFGTMENVKFDLDAFGPYWPGMGKEKYQLATSPLAMFNITAVNNGSTDAEVAVTMEYGTGGSPDGEKAISFGNGKDYLMVDCDGATPTFSAGGTGSFESDGTLSNAAGNSVAAKCTVPAGETVNFKFVLSWYRTYDQEGYYYHNFYDNAKDAADFGMSKFDSTRNSITSFVDRVMGSNFPEWYNDRLLNNTYPLVHNSVCAADGRCAFWEGCYGIIGTIDQGQHAAVFYTFNWPSVQWHELQYWSRQQRSSGQVHHDFNEGRQNFSPNSTQNNRHLLPWDDKNHADYWWFPQTETWADLNSMYIFKAYELVMATGEVDSLKLYWESIKKSAGAILAKCKNGSKL
ncbi:MAG: hypothetical protein OQK82_06955, partial [Candidatus Pacearchaeota archaeon]|nr:hypothetical protein [Candidatus Pacearchaeota archaeon]